MSSYSLRSLQFRFSFVHVLIVLGVVLGSMVASYLMGFTSGQSVGLENALAITANQVAKLPIVSPVLDEDVSNQRIDPLAKLESSKTEPAKVAKETEKVQNELKLKQERLEDLSQIPIIKNNEVIPLEPTEEMKKAEALALSKLEADKLEKENLSDSLKTNELMPKDVSRDEKTANEYWYVQLVTTSSKEDVALLRKRLRESGFESYSIKDKSDKGVEVYKVLAGPEKNKELAQRLLSQIKREKYIKVEPFIKKIAKPSN